MNFGFLKRWGKDEDKGTVRKGIVYNDSPNLRLSKEYENISPVVELEGKLKEKFDKIVAESPDYGTLGPEKPEYEFDKDGKRYPSEIAYQIDGINLNISKHEAKPPNEIKIWAEAENEENIKDIFNLIDELAKKNESKYSKEGPSYKFDNGNDEREQEEIKERNNEITSYSWDDVGGLNEQKEEVKKYVEWPLDNPEAFERLGIEPPRGILLYGPPGTGKTLIAKTIASETQANFYNASASQLTSKWYGNSSKKVEGLFQKARDNTPSVVFLDEVDSLFRDREGSHEASQRVVTTFLKNLDGLEKLEDVVFVGATNRKEDLDDAILRSGRLGRQIEVPAPDKEGRKEILQIHTKNSPVKEVDYEQLGRETQGLTGADLKELVDQAGFYAMERTSGGNNISDVDRKDLYLGEDDFYRALENL